MGDYRAQVPERFKLGVFDRGEIAGVYAMNSVSGRPDMEMVECVRADVHQGAVDALRKYADHLRGCPARNAGTRPATCDCNVNGTLARFGGR